MSVVSDFEMSCDFQAGDVILCTIHENGHRTCVLSVVCMHGLILVGGWQNISGNCHTISKDVLKMSYFS